jgi:hypothetical protein
MKHDHFLDADSFDLSRALPEFSDMRVANRATKRRNCRWTRRFPLGRFMASPVTASITVGGSMSPGLNFMAFPLALAILDRFTASRLKPG